MGLDEAARRAPIHERDQAPGFLLRAQAWSVGWLSSESRLVLGLVIVGLGIVMAALFSSFQILRILFDALDILAFVGLFLVNWVGNGGILVPVPGARLVGLLMVFQRAAASPSWEVFAVSGAAMALGLLSYYIAGARVAQSYAEGDTVAAEQLALDTGMLDDDAPDVTPDALPDAGAPGAPASTPPRATGMGRLR
jgi:hypothetical protein